MIILNHRSGFLQAPKMAPNAGSIRIRNAHREVPILFSSESPQEKIPLEKNTLKNELFVHLPKTDEKFSVPPTVLKRFFKRLKLNLTLLMPFIAQQYKEEFEELTNAIEFKQPAFALEYMRRASKLINRSLKLEDKTWETLSLSLNDLLQADLKSKLRSLHSPSLNEAEKQKLDPFERFFEILNDPDCDRIHSFVIASAQHKSILALQELKKQFGTTYNEPLINAKIMHAGYRVLTYAAQRLNENAALYNLYHALDNPSRPFYPSLLERTLLTQYALRIGAAKAGPYQHQWQSSPPGPDKPDAIQDIQKNLFGNQDIGIDHLNRSLRLSGLSLETRLRLKDEVRDLPTQYNAANIQAAYKLFDDLCEILPDLQDKKESMILHVIQKHPSAPVVQGLLHYLSLKQPQANTVEKLLEFMGSPNFQHCQLILAKSLTELTQPYPTLAETLKQKLTELDIAASGESYLNKTPQAMMKRFSASLYGQEKLKTALSKELTQMVEKTNYTPMLYLNGTYGIGKTSTADKLAAIINSTIEQQTYSSDPELFSGLPEHRKTFNTHLISLKKAENELSIEAFQKFLDTRLLLACQNSEQGSAEQKSTVLIFDELSAFGQDAEDPDRLQKAKILANTLLNLYTKQVYVDRFNETHPVSKPIVLLTGNPEKGLQDESPPPFNIPFFRINHPLVNHLKKLLEQDKTVQMVPLSSEDIRGLVNFTLQKIRLTFASSKQIHVQISGEVIDALTALNTKYQSSGRDITAHLFKYVASTLEKDALAKPGSIATVKIQNYQQLETEIKDKLWNLDSLSPKDHSQNAKSFQIIYSQPTAAETQWEGFAS